MAGEKILIVDDDANFVKALTVRLKANGYQIAVAFDGTSAISAARRENPDLVLLDILLPAGDGITVLKRLGQLPATLDIPVIVITAKTDMETEIDATVEGVAGYIRKPIESEQLLKLIRETLEKKTS